MSLRKSIMLSFMALVVILSGAFAYSVHRFIEIVEERTLHQEVTHELSEFAASFRGGRTILAEGDAGYLLFAVPAGQQPLLPAALQTLSANSFAELDHQGRGYLASRRDAAGYQLYLAVESHPMESLQAMLIAQAVVIGLAGLVLAGLVAIILSRLVTQPVREIAQRLAQFEPQRRGQRLGIRTRQQDVANIADSYDGFLQQLDDFIEREQRFTGDASHELRTPLAIIQSSAQLLQMQPNLPAAAVAHVQRIKRAGERQLQTLDALLFLAREKAASPSEPLALDELVREIASDLAAQHQARALDIRVQTEPVVVHAPAGMAMSVVTNLLTNAIQHTETGAINLRLTADRLTVQDQGRGIDPATVDKIFDEGYRGPESRGSGIGLHLVQRICTRLGWRLSLESTPEGSVFIVALR